jgi:uncharacterized protein
MPGEDTFEDIADAMGEALAADASGHDIHHAWRVFALGRRLTRAEGADPLVVGAAALVHDVHRVVGDGGYIPPADSLPRVESILREAGFPEDRVEEVLHCVAVHEAYGFGYTEADGATDPGDRVAGVGDGATEDGSEEATVGDGSPAETVEALVLQDADNLDAIGAVGVARAFAFGGAHGSLLWDEHPVPERGNFDPDPERADTLGHFRSKLLHLAEHMNTKSARDLAAERHAFLEAFVDRFEREWRGEA